MSRQSTAHRRPLIHSCPSRSSHNPVRPAPRVCAWLCTPVHACVHECACARARGGEVAASPDWSGCGPWFPGQALLGFRQACSRVVRMARGSGSSSFSSFSPWRHHGWGGVRSFGGPRRSLGHPGGSLQERKEHPPRPSPARVLLLPSRPATAEAGEERPVRRLVRGVWLPLLQAPG